MRKRIVALMMTLVMLVNCSVGCGNVTTEDTQGENTVSTDEADAESKDTKESNDSKAESDTPEVESKEEEVEPTYTEGAEVVLLDNVDHNQVKEENWIDIASLSLIEGENYIVITKEVDIYHIDGLYAGYAKVGTRPVWIAGDEEWNTIVFEDGMYLVKTSDLPDAMMLASEYDKQNQVADNNNSESSDSDETTQNTENTYTVTDMSKTMYAKQSVNVRKGPNSDFERVGGLSTNQEVKVTGQADTGWYRIAYNGGEAYVSNSYLSDNRVEVATTNPETGSGGDTTTSGGSGTEAPSQPAETVPETPGTSYSEAEVIAIVRSTLEGAGIQWYPDSDEYQQYLQHPELYSGLEIGPDGGMGWGIGDFSMTDPQTDANELLKGFQWDGSQYYYIESLGVSNGKVSLKVYSG